jgi:hypothetical protein
MAAVAPYSPGTQSVQAPAPASAYLPDGHWAAVEVVDPAGHAYPAAQFPVQVAVVSPAVDPNVPAGQSVQAPAPASEYLPATH